MTPDPPEPPTPVGDPMDFIVTNTLSNTQVVLLTQVDSNGDPVSGADVKKVKLAANETATLTDYVTADLVSYSIWIRAYDSSHPDLDWYTTSNSYQITWNPYGGTGINRKIFPNVLAMSYTFSYAGQGMPSSTWRITE